MAYQYSNQVQYHTHQPCSNDQTVLPIGWRFTFAVAAYSFSCFPAVIIVYSFLPVYVFSFLLVSNAYMLPPSSTSRWEPGLAACLRGLQVLRKYFLWQYVYHTLNSKELPYYMICKKGLENSNLLKIIDNLHIFSIRISIFLLFYHSRFRCKPIISHIILHLTWLHLHSLHLLLLHHHLLLLLHHLVLFMLLSLHLHLHLLLSVHIF